MSSKRIATKKDLDGGLEIRSAASGPIHDFKLCGKGR